MLTGISINDPKNFSSTTSAEQQALAHARPRMKITWHRRPTFDQAFAQWRALENRLHWQALTSTTRWTQTWLKHYGDLVSPEIVIAEVNHIPVAALLVITSEQQFEGPIRLRTVHMGTAGELDSDSAVVEYNTICAEPAYQELFLENVMQVLANRTTWDEIRLDGFEPRDIQTLLENYPQFTLRQRPCYCTNFPPNATPDSILEQLTSQARRAIRRNLRSYEGAVVEWGDHVELAEEIFDDLIRLHQARWNAEGQPGAYASAPFLSFHKHLLKELVAHRQAVLVRVRRGDEVIGCSHLLIDRQRGLLYQSGHAPHESQRSPGLLTDWLTLLACHQHGLTAFDFMAGETYHKRRLTLDTNELLWARWIRPSWKRTVIDRLRDFKRFSHRLISGSSRSTSSTRPSANEPDLSQPGTAAEGASS